MLPTHSLMKQIPLLLAAIAAINFPAHAHDYSITNPDQLLRAMSSKLAAGKQFSFVATRELDPVLALDGVLPEKARVGVNVSRPSQFAARSVSRERTMRFVADGRKLTIANETKKHYAQVPMRTTIDGLVDKLDQEFGFVPPLADFAVSNPYREIRQQARTVAYAGLEKVGGGFLGIGAVECHHLKLKGRMADAELWIATGDQLPRKMVATFHGAGRAQLRIAFSDWNLAAAPSAGTFTFIPPQGAEKIEMWTTARMHAARKPLIAT